MQDGAARGRIAAVLGRAGWTVVPQPTEFHLIQAIAGVIDGRHPELSPSLSEIRASAGT